MKHSSAIVIALLAMAGSSLAARAQSADDAIFCSGFELGDDGTCGPATLNEGFDDIQRLVPDGWLMVNHSDPLGSTSWYQGETKVFSAVDGEPASYIAADLDNVDQDGTISNWLITPVLEFDANTTVTFYTRTDADPDTNLADYPDRLQVRVCAGSGCSNVGIGAGDVGDFTSLLLTINPNLTGAGYPVVWTRYSIDAADGLPTSGHGRIAFRYYVTNAGLNATNGNYIGIDSVSIQ